MQIYKMLYNAVATCMDLTLKITSTFVSETVKIMQIQLSGNTIKFSVSKKTLIHFTYADYFVPLTSFMFRFVPSIMSLHLGK